MNNVIWMTGLSGAGKTTIAEELYQLLILNGDTIFNSVLRLDGDVVRRGLCKDLGFTSDDRRENVRRIAEVANLAKEQIVIVSAISPFAEDRDNAKSIIGERFVEVFVDTSLDECKRRDPKGLYKKVESGETKNFTGVDSAYQSPKNPDIHIFTEQTTAKIAAEVIFRFLKNPNSIAPSLVVPSDVANKLLDMYNK